MSWEKKRADHPHTPEIRSSSYSMLQYVHCFVQATANTKTSFNLFSATSNRRKCLKKSKTLRRIAEGTNLFLSTTANSKKYVFFFRLRRIREKMPQFFFGRNEIFRLRRKRLRAQNRVVRCAQPASPRLLRRTAILTQMLRQRNSATSTP